MVEGDSKPGIASANERECRMAWIPAVTWNNGNARLRHILDSKLLLFDGKRMFWGGLECCRRLEPWLQTSVGNNSAI